MEVADLEIIDPGVAFDALDLVQGQTVAALDDQDVSGTEVFSLWAAEVVAAAAGHPGTLPKPAAFWVKAHRDFDFGLLVPLAEANVERVLAASETLAGERRRLSGVARLRHLPPASSGSVAERKRSPLS